MLITSKLIRNTPASTIDDRDIRRRFGMRVSNARPDWARVFCYRWKLYLAAALESDVRACARSPLHRLRPEVDPA